MIPMTNEINGNDKNPYIKIVGDYWKEKQEAFE